MISNKNGSDRRARRTRRILKEAFISLVHEKGYRSVTITDIVNRSDYNRATFYVYFKDKEDLTEEIMEEMINSLKNALRHPFKQSKHLEFDRLSPSSVLLFQHIYDNAHFYNLLKEPDPIPNIQNEFINTIKNLFKEELRFLSDQSLDINNDYFISYRAYGIFGLIIDWIKSNYALSPTDMAKQLINILNSHSPSVRENRNVH